PQTDHNDRLAVTHERHANHRAVPFDLGVLLLFVDRIGPSIVDPRDFPGHRCTADDGSRPRINYRSPFDFQKGWDEAVPSREAVNSAFQLKNYGPVRAAEPCRSFG